MADADPPPVKPALAKVTIFEIAERPWGWLTTSAEVDDRVYVGSRRVAPTTQCRVPSNWIQGPILGTGRCRRGTRVFDATAPSLRAGSAVRADPVSEKKKHF